MMPKITHKLQDLGIFVFKYIKFFIFKNDLIKKK